MIGEVFNPMNLDEVQRNIARVGIEVAQVCSMGKYKFFITLNSINEAGDAIN